MARYQIMYWKDIPAQIKAEDESGTVKFMLPDRFSEAIDNAAMAEGSADSEAYLDGWSWGAEQERPGTARQVAEAVAAELDQAFPRDRLTEMIKRRKVS